MPFFQKSSKRVRLLVPLLLALLSLWGCAGTTTVPLRYATVAGSGLDCATSLRVAPFEDARGGVEGIGRTADGRTYFPDRLVEDWITRSLRAELESSGCRVSRNGGEAEFTLRGRIDSAWLTQLSRTDYRVRLSLQLRIFHQGRKIHTESFKASLERKAFPRASVPQQLMQETLQDVMRVMVPKVLEVCREAAGT